METKHLIEKIKTRLKQPLPGLDAQMRMAPSSRSDIDFDWDSSKAIPSSVMILLFVKNNSWHTLYIQRAEDGYAHSGQISFPGGRYELHDSDLQTTALRETAEEIGINTNKITVLGELTSLYIPVSNFRVHPFIGIWETPDRLEFNIEKNEVANVEIIAVDSLFETENKSETTLNIRNHKIDTPYYNVNNKILWGATAMITSELEEIWLNLVTE